MPGGSLTDEPGAVVSVGLVSLESGQNAGHQATVRDLWVLASEALANHGVPSEPLVDMGDVAFLAHCGGRTAQVAWLTADRLATVSVTCLGDEQQWTVDSARSIAVEADGCLARYAVGGLLLTPRVG